MWPFDKLDSLQKQVETQQLQLDSVKLDAQRALAHRKMTARAVRSYKGAVIDRTVADWVATNASADAEIKSGIAQLRNRSRQLCRDNDYAKSARRTIVNNVVGQGIGFQSQVRMKRGGKLNAEMNAAIEAAWSRWQRKENCHTAGILCFSDIEHLVMGSVFESGEVLIRFIDQRMGSSKVPLALEVIEADQLDENYNGIGNNGNTIRMGVEFSEWRRPVAYHFFARHPGDDQVAMPKERVGRRMRVPADEVLHLFVTDRVNQTRGVPWLHSAMLRLRHMGGYEEAEVIGARVSASLMGFIESAEADPSIKDDEVDGESVTDFEPGLIKKLNPGEHMNVPTIARPGGQFDPFMRLMLRGVAAGAGASYESISRDYSQSNYSSSRQAMLEDRDTWRVLQAWLARNFHQRVYERWLALAVLSGELKISDYEVNVDAYDCPRWMPRGWSWVDPEKEVNAYEKAVRNGFMTQSEVVAQSGGDYEDLVVQRKAEVELAKQNGLVFDTDPNLVDGSGAKQFADASAAPKKESTGSA